MIPNYLPDITGDDELERMLEDGNRAPITSAKGLLARELDQWEAAVARAVRLGAGVDTYPLAGLAEARLDPDPYVVEDALFRARLYLARFRAAADGAETLRVEYRNRRQLELQQSVDPDAGVVKATGEPKKYTQEKAEAMVRSDPEYLQRQHADDEAALERDVCAALVESLAALLQLRINKVPELAMDEGHRTQPPTHHQV